MKKIVYIYLLIGILSTFVCGEDILVPYDENGFYGGAIILMILIYVGIPFMLLSAVGGLIALFLFPKIISEFKTLIEMYYNIELKQALKKHLVHFLIFTPIAFSLIYGVYSFFEVSNFYLFILLVFLYSSFFGLYIFLYFAMSLYFKNWIKIFIALLLGGGVFIFFASSAYFVFEPVYMAYSEDV